MSIDPRRIEVIDDKTAEILRAKTGAERVGMIDEMARFTLNMLRTKFRVQHPEWSDAEVIREAARRISRGAV